MVTNTLVETGDLAAEAIAATPEGRVTLQASDGEQKPSLKWFNIAKDDDNLDHYEDCKIKAFIKWRVRSSRFTGQGLHSPLVKYTTG